MIVPTRSVGAIISIVHYEKFDFY